MNRHLCLKTNSSLSQKKTRLNGRQATLKLNSAIQQPKQQRKPEEVFEHPPKLVTYLVYFTYLVLNTFGYLRDFLRNIGIEKNSLSKEKNREGYLPLTQNAEGFYARNFFRRARIIAAIPICSVPGPIVKIKERISHDHNVTFQFTNHTFDSINMGSYNYLGFAENSGKCTDSIEKVIFDRSVGICSTRHELGSLDIHTELETLVAEFLGTESSIVIGMGFATNSTNIPTIVSKGCLILSDKMNHASIALGCKISSAKIQVFKHNNMTDLEEKLRSAIITGQPFTQEPWKKIIVMVEGVYSMEGTIVNLPALIALKKKYKFYLYLDEAHSIGAIGRRGRGVCDYYSCSPRDVDLLMGTFSKSFGAAGGYIAGSKKLVDHLRRHSYSFAYGTSMSACIAQQIITTIKIITGRDGSYQGPRRIRQLQRNTLYFRRKLKQKGFIVYGNEDSPVVPMLLYFPSMVPYFVMRLLKEGIATAGVAPPVVPYALSRIRFCISSAHTKEMLDKTLSAIEEVGRLMMVDYSKQRTLYKEDIPY